MADLRYTGAIPLNVSAGTIWGLSKPGYRRDISGQL